MGKISDFFSSQGITLAIQQKQQMVALDKEFDSLQSKVTRLDAENLKLRAEVNPLKDEVERLKNKIEKDSAHDAGRLDEIEITILQVLSNIPSGHLVIADGMASQLGVSKTKAEYHLERLEKTGFIHGAHYYTGQPTEYRLAHPGREYLVKHNLV